MKLFKVTRASDTSLSASAEEAGLPDSVAHAVSIPATTIKAAERIQVENFLDVGMVAP